MASNVLAGEALNLLNDKAYDQAFRKAYVALLKSADGEASFVLGKIYAEGLGTSKKNEAKAMEYLTVAADQNDNRDATLYLARELASGALLKKNSSKALTYYEKAESKGWGNFSQEKLSLLGSGQLNEKVCSSLAKVIGKNSSASDLSRYGRCLVDGIGIKKDTSRAKNFFNEALEKKFANAGILLLEKYYLSDLRNFDYSETFLVFDQISESNLSDNELKKIGGLIESSLTQLFLGDSLTAANTIFYEIATHDLATATAKFSDPKTLDVTTLKISFKDCSYAFDNRVKGAAQYFCKLVSKDSSNTDQRSQAIELMASNPDFFGGSTAAIEKDLIELARAGDSSAIDTIFRLYSSDSEKIIAIAKQELQVPGIHESFNKRIQDELNTVFKPTLAKIQQGKPINPEEIDLIFSIPHCPTVDLFIENSDRAALKVQFRSLEPQNLVSACAEYGNVKFLEALVQIRQVDYRAAIDTLKDACGRGSGKACVEMADLYIENKVPGIDSLTEKARMGLYEEILERAISLEELEAYVLLGGILVEASGGPREEKGLKLLQQAYSRGAIDALYLIAADELKSCFFCSAKTCQRLAGFITQADSTSRYLIDAKDLYRKKRCD